MKKEKKFKLSDDQKQVVALFKSTVEEYAASGVYGTFCGFNEDTTKSDYRISAELDGGRYKAFVTYSPTVLLENHFFDVVFKFGTDREYTIYDVFNLFDIDDFTQYYTPLEIADEKAVKSCIFNLLELIKKYDYDLKKVSEPVNMQRLEENRQQDLKLSYGKSYSPEEEPDIFDIDITHPYFSGISDAKDSAKILKKLEKADSKGKLGTIYEKRLLEYLRKGNKYENTAAIEKSKTDKSYLVKTILFDVILFLCSAVVSALIIWAIRSAVFAGAFVPQGRLIILGSVEIPFSLEQLLGGAFASVILSVFMHNLFGKKLFKMIFPNDEKLHSRFNAETDISKGKTTFQKIFSVVWDIVLVLVCVAVFIFAGTSDIGFYDDYAKYVGSGEPLLVSVKYDDAVLYTVDGEYDDDDNFKKYENGYAISDKSGNYYLIGDTQVGGKTDTRMKKIAKDYNKKFVHIKSVEDIAE